MMFSLAAKEAEGCTHVGQTKRALKTRFKEHLFKIKKKKKKKKNNNNKKKKMNIDTFFINIPKGWPFMII